jgi:hypothetical protein
MLFRKKIERACAHCTHGTCLEDGTILCCKKGIKKPQDKCLRFKYDPCKRIPVKAKPLDFSRYNDEDYTL